MSARDPSSSSIFPRLASLPLTSPSLLPLLSTHRPFHRPSHLPGSAATKFVGRISITILARDSGVEEKYAALGIGKELVQQDTEGWVLAGWGKGWVGSTLGALSAPSLALGSVKLYLALLQALVLASPASPSFEREAIHPIMGKLSTTLLKLAERSIGQTEGNEDVLLEVLRSTRTLLVHSPPAFRPIVNPLRTLLLPLIISSPSTPALARDTAVGLLASLYLTQGKAAVAQGWRAEMGDAMAGVGACMDAIIAAGWMEGGNNRPASPFPPGLAAFPVDAPSRLPIALQALEGYTEIILALLNQSTSRPVPVPIAYIVRLAIRCLDLTLYSPTVPYISPQYDANLTACLPRLWTVGIMLLGIVATSCGDHLLTHLTDILDTTLHLADSTPDSFTQTQTQLLRLHNLLVAQYPSGTWYPDHPPRLLKLCLAKLSPLLDSTTPTPAVAVGSTAANGVGGKKGKKRARGEEDGLIASLEGREGRRVGVEGGLALEALRLIPLLHSTPLLPPPLLTLSIRLHLSLYLSLPGLSTKRFADPILQSRLIQAVRNVLERACLMVEEGGHSKGWKSVILGVLEPVQGRLSPLLHPQLPAPSRPAPSLSTLHYFTAESEEEVKIRHELGLHTARGGASQDSEQDEDQMEADENTEEAAGTVVVPVAPNDVRAGKKDIANPTLPLNMGGRVRLQDPNTPQPGHHPHPPTTTLPTAGINPVTSVASTALPTAGEDEVSQAQPDVVGAGLTGTQGGNGFIPFIASTAVATTADIDKGKGKEREVDEGIQVDDGDAGSDEGIPDLDSEMSGFEDDDDEEE